MASLASIQLYSIGKTLRPSAAKVMNCNKINRALEWSNLAGMTARFDHSSSWYEAGLDRWSQLAVTSTAISEMELFSLAITDI